LHIGSPRRSMAVTTLHTVYCSRSTIIGSRIIAKLRSVGVFDLLAGNPDPVVLALLPHRECGRGEIGVVECAQGNCDQPVELAVDLVMHVGPAVGAEVKGDPVATVADVHMSFRPALDRHPLRRPARLNGKGAARPLLAIKA